MIGPLTYDEWVAVLSIIIMFGSAVWFIGSKITQVALRLSEQNNSRKLSDGIERRLDALEEDMKATLHAKNLLQEEINQLRHLIDEKLI